LLHNSGVSSETSSLFPIFKGKTVMIQDETLLRKPRNPTLIKTEESISEKD